MSGGIFSNGRCGLSRSSTNKSDPSSCSTKPQGSEQKKSMSPNARCPGKRMSLNETGCKACSRLGSKAEREKLARRCRKRCASSSLICTLNFPLCPGEKLPRCATFGTAEGQTIRVSNTLPPPAPPSSLQARRYQPWHQIPDPAERKLAVIRLHSEGWSHYVHCSVYANHSAYHLRHAPALGGGRSCGLRGEVEGQKAAAQGHASGEKRDPQTSAEPFAWGVAHAYRALAHRDRGESGHLWAHHGSQSPALWHREEAAACTAPETGDAL